LIYGVSYFNFRGLGALFCGGLAHQSPPAGDSNRFPIDDLGQWFST